MSAAADASLLARLRNTDLIDDPARIEAAAEIERLTAELVKARDGRAYQKDRAVKARVSRSDIANGLDHWKVRALTAEVRVLDVRAETIEELAAWHDCEATIVMNSLHCGDNSATIASHRRRSDWHTECAAHCCGSLGS